ncbi:uncharacterized protein LOC114306214 isoform X1 [Camellia sinensis]|uniref:DC1 domain-containing protein n=1 Tax=Camellia sinensis var. sinensis TaxID=542762 RepID=A0A4S4DWG9_CAMSN|nr:uncharacterized protein LOC114306214 isoform X1 [Camellia sinensis]THG07708.1 hypothetical protein TEA_009657 [Camellia sinensis var. sinensis]
MSTKSFRKYHSMELQASPPPPYQSPTALRVFKKSYSFEFPTSPQPPTIRPEDQIIHHPSHQQHPLVRLTTTLPNLFTCSGCKDYGAGKRFACQQCDFQLHEFCALSPPSLDNHPLHPQHLLLFNPKSKQGAKCDICNKPTKGFAFCCSAAACSFQMHPCCAMFSSEMKFSVHPHSLKLISTSGGGDPAGFVCSECKRKRSGWVFRCTVCDYHLHAVCAKDMINGLQANGIKAPVKPNKLASAVRIASMVITQFIGGLVQGIGEGLGQAILQDAMRGRRFVSIRRRAA